ncbi:MULTISPECIES: PrsW family intramembrane metalloprotease [unclassified Methanosarcina]|jgi:RsiW-degrading membrane proteinase PrsW (M82 family)|uniref:PrsW family intramembrane metalloprotease n=1 Tax=unclassified Methanosarcina TaxID=2644672 RepID=UPI0025FA2933|nr:MULTISPECIES: PrsW family glutamic-type intramembrane protease [unclassified Methanosarcina]
MDSATEFQPPVPVVRRNGWLKALTTAAVFYILLLVALLLTKNSNLFPSLAMVGSFMVPVAYVAFIYERKHLSRLTMPTVSLTFIYGGLLGIIAAALVEPIFVRQLDLGAILKIGFIEEFAKILGVLVIARHRRHDSEMDGLILGAAAGMGFAALESNGYAFTVFLKSNGSLSLVVVVTLIRGLLSPLGHGTWTAILASVLFRESRNGHFLINLQVIEAYLLVSILHAMWDGTALVLTAIFNLVGLLISDGVIGLIGLAILWLRWREAVRLQTVLPPETEDI